MPSQPDPGAVIDTERLSLVPLRVEDAAEMADVLADRGLYGFIGGEPPSAETLTERYAAQVRGSGDEGEDWRNWIVRERASGAAAGFVQATIIAPSASADASVGQPDRAVGASPTAEIAWVIGVPWQGRGYATESARAVVAWLEASGVTTIVAHVHPDHAASAAVAAQAGLGPTDAFVDGERVWQRVQAAGNRGSRVGS